MKGTVNRWPEFQELGTSNEVLVNDPRNYPVLQPGADMGGHEHNPFYVKASDGRYYDIAPEFSEPQVSRGIAVADVDGGGRLDFAVANMWGVSSFYHSVAGLEHDSAGLVSPKQGRVE